MLYEDYLKNLDIAPLYDYNAIMSKISEATDQATLEKLLELMDGRADGSDDESIYSVMNSSLKLSLAFVGSMDGSYLKKCLRAIEKSKEYLGETIADIGCNNGIITCFLAMICPESKVVGYDINENAVCVARELAERLNLTNVSFEVADLNNIKQNFSTVFTSKISHEFVDVERINWKTNKDGAMSQYTKLFAKYAERLSSVIEPEGTFLTIDRIAYTAGYFGLYKALSHCGVNIIRDQYKKITFTSVEQEETMPFAIFRKNKQPAEKEVDSLFHSIPAVQYYGLEQSI